MEGNQLDELDSNAGAYYKGNSTVLEGDAEDTQTLAKVVFGCWLFGCKLDSKPLICQEEGNEEEI
eukprot:scaffold5605_cov128-Cylindrotheca_fusiformis.AAC.11